MSHNLCVAIENFSARALYRFFKRPVRCGRDFYGLKISIFLRFDTKRKKNGDKWPEWTKEDTKRRARKRKGWFVAESVTRCWTQYYDRSTDSYSQNPDLIKARNRNAVVAIKKKLFAVGGGESQLGSVAVREVFASTCDKFFICRNHLRLNQNKRLWLCHCGLAI